MLVPAQQIDRCYQEIPTGLTALGMTEKNGIYTDHLVIARALAPVAISRYNLGG